MGWKFKLLRDSIVTFVPARRHIREIINKLRPLPIQIDEWTLMQGLRQIEMIRSTGGSIEGKIIIELGTGWYPLIPLLFHFAGAKKVIMVDSQRLIDNSTLNTFLDALPNFSELISSKLNIDKEIIISRLKFAKSDTLEETFYKLHMEYMAPCDARNLGFEEETIDIITSRSVFAHIPLDVLHSLMQEFHRVLSKNALMCHIIDNSDHFEHIDHSISRLNFLKFNDMLWRFTSFNPLNNLNRLRHFEYLDIFSTYGFDLLYDDSPPDNQALKDLQKMKICDRYKNVSHQELARLTSYVVLQKKG